MPRLSTRRIQDSVHGLMEFRGTETLVIEILRTAELQRLRRIRQLGLAHLVFPGAEHSRLVHCLGAAWLATRFGRHLANSPKGTLSSLLLPGDNAIRDLAVAALCHDLGHGPLSHAWEREVIGEGYDAGKWADKLGLPESVRGDLQRSKWHELVTTALVLWPDGELNQMLERIEIRYSERIAQLLRGRYWLKYLPRLLSSDIDVDRADFIRRDTYQSGVAYGRYDLDWLISTCSLGLTESGELVVGFDQRKAYRTVEQFLIARQALYEAVYYHKTVHAAEGMVALFLRRLKDVVSSSGEFTIDKLLSPYVKVISGEAIGPEEILRLDDFSLSVLIDVVSGMSSMDPTVRDLGHRILSRDLFKLVPCGSSEIEDYLGRPESYDRIFAAIKPFCTGDPRYYLVVDRISFKMFGSDRLDCAFFLDDDRKATPIKEHPQLRSYDKSDRAVRLFTVAGAIDAVAGLIQKS
jgi:HD superfamily phosphohydrolase